MARGRRCSSRRECSKTRRRCSKPCPPASLRRLRRRCERLELCGLRRQPGLPKRVRRALRGLSRCACWRGCLLSARPTAVGHASSRRRHLRSAACSLPFLPRPCSAGTHVAGTIAAQGNNGIGVRPLLCGVERRVHGCRRLLTSVDAPVSARACRVLAGAGGLLEQPAHHSNQDLWPQRPC